MKSKLIKIFLFLLITAGFCFGGYGEGTSVSGKILSRTEKTFSKVLNGSHEPLAEPIVEGLSSAEVSGDLDKNKIEDLLDEEVEKTIGLEKEEKVVVLLNVPFDESLLKEFRFLGGKPEHTYKYATQGFSGTIPVGRIKALADRLGPNLKIIKKAKPIVMHLDKSVRIIRARDAAWTYGYAGTSTNPIAILDTGIDDSHTDLSGKVAAWHDTTSDNSPSPEDYQSHGTHVASTAAGSGAALGTTSLSTLTLTFSGKYPSQIGYGYVDMFELPSAGTVTLNMYHGQGKQTTWLDLRYPDINTSLGYKSGTSDPFIGSWNVTGIGTYFAISGQNDATLLGDPYSTLETFPYSQVGDGYNLFTGVAPNAKLVGVKIFDNTGTGYDTNIYAAFDWLIANKQTYKIKVASMSAGLTVEDPDLRAAANNVVANGIVFTISAGNDYPDATIKDPALASKVLTVGATNDNDQMTDYSSNGSAGSSKPDVAAPGGSFQLGSKITAVDTNDSDGDTVGFADRQSNDYTNMGGTSMSTPHVAGSAALVVQALEANGYTWSYTEADALKVKMLILMTANETNTAGEDPDGAGGTPPNTPPLNRGEKDLVEGHGRINADAAIEAVTTEHTGSTEYATFGSSPLNKKVWARKVNLPSGQEITFNLNVPTGADYDLYLYRGTPDASGNPVILATSTSSTTGNTETISYAAPSSEVDYLVVKWVSGSGQFSLSSNLTPTPVINVALYKDASYSQEEKFFDNGDTVYIQANITLAGNPLTGATVTSTLKVNNGAFTEDSFILNEVGSGMYQKAWNSTNHTNDVYLVALTTNYSPPGSGQAYFHLYPGSNVSAYQFDYDKDGNKDYALENKHLIAIFDGATNTDKSLLYLYQKDTDVNYNFASISDTDTIGRGEITTSNLKGLKFYSLAFSQSGENLPTVNLNMTTEVSDPPKTTILSPTSVKIVGDPLLCPDDPLSECRVTNGYFYPDGTTQNNCTDVYMYDDGSQVYSCSFATDQDAASGAYMQCEFNVSAIPSGSTIENITYHHNYYGTQSGAQSFDFKYYNCSATSWVTGQSYTVSAVGEGDFYSNNYATNFQPWWEQCTGMLKFRSVMTNPNWVGKPSITLANDMCSLKVGYTLPSIATILNATIQMKTEDVDYLVYKLSNFDANIDDISNIFAPISGTLGSSVADDRYHFGNGTDDLVSSLATSTWIDFTTTTDQQKYVAAYDNSNVISWVYFPNASSTVFQDVGAWYETGKEGLRIRYDTTSATSTNQAEYILAFTKGDWSNIDFWMPSIASAQLPIPNFMTAATTLIRSNFPAGSWQMLSVSLVPENPDPEAVLSDDLGTIFSDWLLARWHPLEEEYQYHKASYSTSTGWAQSTTTLPNFSPGLAYWLITALGPYDIDAAGTLTPNNDYYIHLSPGPATTTGGWNQIGVPFNYSVAWSSSTIEVKYGTTTVDLDTAQANNWVENKIWWWDEVNSEYAFTTAPSGQLDPWAGYWVHNFIECDLIVSPVSLGGASQQAASVYHLPVPSHPEPAPPHPERSSHPERSEGSQHLIFPDWKLQLSVSAGSVRDTYNFAGIAPEAKNDYDALDVLEPPPISYGVQLYFPHPDWSFNPGNYTQDIRKSEPLPLLHNPKRASKEWYFEIKSDLKNTPVTLKWTGLEQIKNYELSLIDLDANQVIDIYNTLEYTYNSAEQGIRHFKLTAK